MMPAEKMLWEELRANKLGVQCDLTPVPSPNGEGRLLREGMALIISLYALKTA